MFKNIKKVIYKKNPMPSLTEYFELEIHEDTNVLKYTDNREIDTLKTPKIAKVEDELVMQYFDKLFRIIDGWKEEYKNNNSVDGIEWQLQVIYKNGESKQYSGKNNVPNNFEYLDKIKYEIINKMLESKI